jgi:hypothetical protein
VRLFVLIAGLLLGLGTPDATACPPVEACLVSLKTTVADPVKTPEARRAAEVVSAFEAPLPVVSRPDPTVVEMPWIWKSIRERVYSRMPTYEEPNEVKIVLAPVVVTTPSDTVPGLGIAGAF